MSWIARGLNDDGFVQATPNGQSPSVPALATHHGELWCLWSDLSGNLYYARGDNNIFQPRQTFPDRGIPVMAELTGQLHAIIVRDDGEMAHYLYSDVDEIWTTPAILDPRAGFVAHSTPAFMAFHNKLFLVFVQNNNLYYSIWAVNPQDDTTTWTPVQEVSGIKTVTGIPALFVLNNTLHVLCGANDNSGEIYSFAYDVPTNIWNSNSDVSEGRAAIGVSATSYGDSAFLAFQENGPEDSSHTIFVSEYRDGQWAPHEAVAGQTSTSPPQLAVLNGRINCIFNANDEGMELRWYSRPLLDFELGTWMGGIPDEVLLSDITLPGTHDTCARSNVPFVRTQYLSVAKQMEAGLRFLDLRCRVHDDGQLYMYHGGIPINFPTYLKFDDVMQEVRLPLQYFILHDWRIELIIKIGLHILRIPPPNTHRNSPSINKQRRHLHLPNQHPRNLLQRHLHPHKLRPLLSRRLYSLANNHHNSNIGPSPREGRSPPAFSSPPLCTHERTNRPRSFRLAKQQPRFHIINTLRREIHITRSLAIQ